MSNTVIDIENISKQYMLGSFGTGTLSHDLNRWWARVRGKEDPFLRVGDTNDRTKKSDSDFVWALRDISFKVEQGDVVGIIGKNGAGKSTLLKILSRVTSPTLGSIKIKGRLASLLEVGTGFHSEMTGRENIFMNGSIMGMTKQEIKSKLDEIVDFAGLNLKSLWWMRFSQSVMRSFRRKQLARCKTWRTERVVPCCLSATTWPLCEVCVHVAWC